MEQFLLQSTTRTYCAVTVLLLLLTPSCSDIKAASIDAREATIHHIGMPWIVCLVDGKGTDKHNSIYRSFYYSFKTVIWILLRGVCVCVCVSQRPKNDRLCMLHFFFFFFFEDAYTLQFACPVTRRCTVTSERTASPRPASRRTHFHFRFIAGGNRIH